MSQKGLPSLLERHWAESILAIAAIVIAAVSLWVAFDSQQTNRQLVASASWPFVEFSTIAPVNSPTVSFVIANDGIGPAKLESFELFWQGRAQSSPWRLLQSCCAQGRTGPGQPGSIEALNTDPGLWVSSDQGIVLRAGEQVPILTYTRSPGNVAIWQALRARFTPNLSVRYCYCSAFNDCWVNTAQMGAPRNLNPPQVRSCPRPKLTYDNTAL